MTLSTDLCILHLCIYASATVSSFLIPKDDVIIGHSPFRRSNNYQPANRDERATWAVRKQQDNGNPIDSDTSSLSILDELKRRWFPLIRKKRDVIRRKRLVPVGLNSRGSYATQQLDNLNSKDASWHIHKRDITSGSQNVDLSSDAENSNQHICRCGDSSKGDNNIALEQRASWLNMKRNELKAPNSQEVAFENSQNTEHKESYYRPPENARANWMAIKRSHEINHELNHELQSRASWLQTKRSEENIVNTGDDGHANNPKQIQERANWMPIKKPSEFVSNGEDKIEPHAVNTRANWLPIKKSDPLSLSQLQERASWLPVKRNNEGTLDHNQDISPLSDLHQVDNRASWMNVKKDTRMSANENVDPQPSGGSHHLINKRATWIPSRDLSGSVYSKPTHTSSKTQHFINGRSPFLPFSTLSDDGYKSKKFAHPHKSFYNRYSGSGINDLSNQKSEYNSLSSSDDAYNKRMPTERSNNEEFGDPYETGYSLNDKRAMWLPTRDLDYPYPSKILYQLNKRMPTEREIYQRMPTERQLFEKMPTLR